MASQALQKYQAAAASMSKQEQAELLRKWVNSRKSAARQRQHSEKTKQGLMGTAGALGAGVVSGYLWGNPNFGPDYKVMGKIPVEWLGAGLGIVFGGLYPIGGQKVSGIIKSMGDGFAAVSGIKLGMQIGAPKGSERKMTISGEDEYAGLDESMGADDDLV